MDSVKKKYQLSPYRNRWDGCQALRFDKKKEELVPMVLNDIHKITLRGLPEEYIAKKGW
jgi:hypothetical protein